MADSDEFVALARPYCPEAVGFVVGDAWTLTQGGPLTHATAVPYLTASAVIARLNYVCPGRWMQSFRRDGGHMFCDLTIDGVVYSDIGDGYNGKALLSDARVRSAWAAGIGGFLRAVPAYELSGELYVKPWRIDGEPWLKLTRAGERAARRAYGRWLRSVGTRAFGDPIDHGNLTMQSNGEGPPMPVTRPGEKRETPGRGHGRQAPPKVTSPPPSPAAPVDPEAEADAKLAVLLDQPDELHTLRNTVNKTMLAQGIESPAERLKVIVNAGDKRGLMAAATRLHHHEQATSTQEGDGDG